jgi:hypothetical protein
MPSSQNKNVIVVGANGSIGKKIAPVFENHGYNAARVSSRAGEHTFQSLSEAFNSLPSHNRETSVVYLNYVKNPFANLHKLLRACLTAKKHSATRFIYFSTFAHDPSFCGIKSADRLPRYRSIVSVYNVNKFIAEFFFVLLARFVLTKLTQSFVVCPGFVIGEDMIWVKIIRNFMHVEELVSPPLKRVLPVIEVEELGKRICALIEGRTSNGELEFSDQITVMEFIEHCTKGATISLPRFTEQTQHSGRSSKKTSLPKEIFFFSKDKC